jgi:hypothetical protein
MFCPVCGRDNASQRRFCASCGTNLETVSQALSGSDENFFAKIDGGLDYFIARYSEHVFKNAPSGALDHKVSKSWRILGQGILTSFLDLLLFLLMWNVLPLRFLLLLISTPLRLLSDRGKHHDQAMLRADAKSSPALHGSASHEWLPEPVTSVTDHTTMILPESESSKTKLDL